MAWFRAMVEQAQWSDVVFKDGTKHQTPRVCMFRFLLYTHVIDLLFGNSLFLIKPL